MQYAYTYDGNGNRLTEFADVGGVREQMTYRYDAVDRLREYAVERVGDPGTRTRTEYDYAVFNRSAERRYDETDQLSESRAYAYDDVDRLTSVDVTVTGGPGYEVTYGHDANGNLTQREDTRTAGEATEFTYDSQNRLTRVTRGPPGAEAVLGEYDYDSRGRRTRNRGSSRGDVEYYYDGITVVEERLTGDGTLLGHYRYGDRLMAMDAPGGREWYHQDSQRTTGTMTDATGSVVSTYRLNPWGEIRGQTGSSTNRQIFTSHQHDPETGLIYMGARYYDPETGRFLTQDAVPGDPQNPPSLNRYLYVYGNPLAYTDPDGNFPVLSHINDALTSFRSWQDGMVQQMQRDVDNGDANHWVAGGLAVLSGVANGIAGIGQGVVSVADAVLDAASVLPLAAVDAVAGTDLSAGVTQRTRDRLDAGAGAVTAVGTYWREHTIGEMAIDLDDSARRYGRALAAGDLATISGTASAVTETVAGGAGTIRGAQRALSAVGRGADALADGARVARQLGVRGSLQAAARGSGSAIRGVAQTAVTSARRITTEVADGARRMTSNATEFGRGFAEGWRHARGAQRGRANAGVPGALTAERAYYGIRYGVGRARRARRGRPPEATVTLRLVDGMDPNQFNRKAEALRELGEQGALRRAASPVARDPSVTRNFRQDLIRRIWDQYGERNRDFARRAIDRVTRRMQPDHVHELQLGGPDTPANLRMLDTFTNWHVGTQQIRPQIRNLDPGTIVRIAVEGSAE